MSLAGELQQAYDAIRLTRIASYSSGAALAFIAYDALVSFGDEVQHIWQQRWSVPKGMYLLIRYYTLVFLSLNFWVDSSVGLPSNFCESYFRFIVVGSSGILIPLVNSVYILRIWSIYDRNRIVLAIVCGLWICDSAVIWSTVIRQATRGQIIEIPSFLHWPGCTVNTDTAGDIGAWVTAFTIATIWLCMTLAKFIALAMQGAQSRSLRLKNISQNARRLSPLLVCIVQDGILFYLPIMCMLIISMIMVVVLNGPLEKILIPWMPAVYSYAGSHLILNLRVAAEPSAWVDTTASTSLVARRLETLALPGHDVEVANRFELRTVLSDSTRTESD